MKQLQTRFPRVGIGAVLRDANRFVSPLRRGPVQRLGSRVTAGYGWNAGDAGTSNWVPQGITGSADANARSTGVVRGQHVQAVSWHNKDDTAVRISFVNLDARPSRYRHVLLVRPTGGGGFANVDVHAGGIVWVGHLMYVADTNRGMRVFDTREIMGVPNSQGRRQQSGNYKYLLPAPRASTTRPTRTSCSRSPNTETGGLCSD